MKSATTANDWRAVYRQAYEENFKSQHPVAYKDHGLPIVVFPKVNTTNGLTSAIVNFLNWSGHYANRINTQGQVRIEKIPLANGRIHNNVKWTPGATHRGTLDIDTIINSKTVKIEVKCAATKDRLSEDQKKEINRILKAGGIAIVIATIEQFFEWYNDFIKQTTPR